MLCSVGCRYVTVGHSERRTDHAEGDDVVAAKVAAALRHGLTPILCVGEGLDVREAGRQVEHTLAQVDAALDGVSVDCDGARECPRVDRNSLGLMSASGRILGRPRH